MMHVYVVLPTLIFNSIVESLNFFKDHFKCPGRQFDSLMCRSVDVSTHRHVDGRIRDIAGSSSLFVRQRASIVSTSDSRIALTRRAVPKLLGRTIMITD